MTEQPTERPDVWTPGTVTRGPDHTTRDGIDRDGADR